MQRVEVERDQWEKKYEVCLAHFTIFPIILLIHDIFLQFTGCPSEIPRVEGGVGRACSEHGRALIESLTLGLLPYRVLRTCVRAHQMLLADILSVPRYRFLLVYFWLCIIHPILQYLRFSPYYSAQDTFSFLRNAIGTEP